MTEWRDGQRHLRLEDSDRPDEMRDVVLRVLRHRSCQRMDGGQNARTKTHDRAYPHLRGLFRDEVDEDMRDQLVVIALASLYT